MTANIKLPDGTEIEEGDHLLVTTTNSVVDNFAGENKMQAQRLVDDQSGYEIYFHDADGNEALKITTPRFVSDLMNLKTADGMTQVADVVSVEVHDDE